MTLLDLGTLLLSDTTLQSVGEIEALDQVTLKSQLNANISQIYTDIGETVVAGDLLIELEHEDLSAQLSQTLASITKAQAALDQTFAGPTEENRKKAEAAVAQAKSGVTQAQAAMGLTQSNDETAVENAILSKESAESVLKNTQKQQTLNITTAYETSFNSARTIFQSAMNLLITFTDIQLKYYYRSTTDGNALSAKKSSSCFCSA